MANIQYSTAWVPDLILAQSIGRLKAKILAGQIGQVTFDAEVKAKPGETIYIPQRGALTVRTKTAGNDYGNDSPSGTKNTFGTLVEKHVTWDMEEQLGTLLRKNKRQTVDGYLDDAMDALASQIDTDIFANYSSMTYSTSGTQLDDTRIRAAKKLLDDQKAPASNRVMVVSSTIENNDLLNATTNPLFNQADRIGSDLARKAIENASIGTVRGFETFMSTNISETVGSASTVHHCLAFRKGALGMVSVPSTTETGPNAISRQINYEGIGLRFREWYDPKAGTWFYSFSIMFATGLADDRQCVSIEITKT
jgi:hypothetical protein